MSWKQLSFLAATSLGMIALGTTMAVAATPNGISPGAASNFVAVATPCPTFSWSAVERAKGYELIVYQAEDVDRTPGEQPVIRTHIAGNGLSWTPSSESCLELAGSYVWSVRALEAAGGSEWSEGRMFRVEAGPFLEQIGGVIERALARYLDGRGVRLAPTGELAGLISAELAASSSAAELGEPSANVSAAQTPDAGGHRQPPAEPATRGVFTDDVELWLQEGGSGPTDKVQLVFATPEFDGDPTFGDAWSIVVNAQDTGSSDDGTMLFSTPSFFDALQLFTDGSAIVGEQRELALRRLNNPPRACTSLQEGQFYWDEQLGELCDCNGSTWAPVDGTGTCS